MSGISLVNGDVVNIYNSSGIKYSVNGTLIGAVSFPCEITLASGTATVNITSNISIISSTQYFYIKSNGITFNGGKSSNFVITKSANNYSGLIKVIRDSSNVVIENVNISCTDTLVQNGGEILQTNTNNVTIRNCNVSTQFATFNNLGYMGGIVGSYCSNITVDNCNVSAIVQLCIYSGGILGPYCSNCVVTNCTYTNSSNILYGSGTLMGFGSTYNTISDITINYSNYTTTTVQSDNVITAGCLLAPSCNNNTISNITSNSPNTGTYSACFSGKNCNNNTYTNIRMQTSSTSTLFQCTDCKNNVYDNIYLTGNTSILFIAGGDSANPADATITNSYINIANSNTSLTANYANITITNTRILCRIFFLSTYVTANKYTFDKVDIIHTARDTGTLNYSPAMNNTSSITNSRIMCTAAIAATYGLCTTSTNALVKNCIFVGFNSTYLSSFPNAVNNYIIDSSNAWDNTAANAALFDVTKYRKNITPWYVDIYSNYQVYTNNTYTFNTSGNLSLNTVASHTYTYLSSDTDFSVNSSGVLSSTKATNGSYDIELFLYNSSTKNFYLVKFTVVVDIYLSSITLTSSNPYLISLVSNKIRILDDNNVSQGILYPFSISCGVGVSGTIKLATDITITTATQTLNLISDNITVDGNNKTITIPSITNYEGFVNVNNGVVGTIVKDLNIITSGSTKIKTGNGCIMNGSASNVTFDKCVLNCSLSSSIDIGCIGYAITNGTFNNCRVTAAISNSAGYCRSATSCTFNDCYGEISPYAYSAGYCLITSNNVFNRCLSFTGSTISGNSTYGGFCYSDCNDVFNYCYFKASQTINVQNIYGYCVNNSASVFNNCRSEANISASSCAGYTNTNASTNYAIFNNCIFIGNISGTNSAAFGKTVTSSFEFNNVYVVGTKMATSPLFANTVTITKTPVYYYVASEQDWNDTNASVIINNNNFISVSPNTPYKLNINKSIYGSMPNNLHNYSKTTIAPNQSLTGYTYALIGAPSGITINSSTATISITRVPVGSYSFYVYILNSTTNYVYYFSHITLTISFARKIDLPLTDICFVKGTLIKTDAGYKPIENIKPSVDSINNNVVVAITETILSDDYLVVIPQHSIGPNIPSADIICSPNHKVFTTKLCKAKTLIGYNGIHSVPYNGQVLHNVLLNEYNVMYVSNLICETLHPNHTLAKIHKLMANTTVSDEDKKLIYEKFNEQVAQVQ